MMPQHLRREDHTKRRHFCVSFQDLCSDEDNFPKKVAIHWWGYIPCKWKSEQAKCSYLGEWEASPNCWKWTWFSEKQMCFVPSPRQKCMARTSFLIEPLMAKHSGTCWLRGLCHNWIMTVLTSSISWMEPHATITVMLGTSLTLSRLMSYIYIYIYIWSTYSWCF